MKISQKKAHKTPWFTEEACSLKKPPSLDIFLKSHREPETVFPRTPIEEALPPIMQGQVLDLKPRRKTPKKDPVENQMRGDRKASLSFSGSSARSLSRLLASLRFRGSIFLTLTQKPGKTPREAKTALDNFFKQLKRDHPIASAIWRLEKQTNGSPHFHILLFGISLADLYLWDPVKNWRHQICTTVNPSAQDMQYVNTNTGAFLYIVGHGTKKNQTWVGQAVGRYWGKHNKACLPFAPETPVDFRFGEEDFLRRYWERSEQRRVDWLSNKYPGKVYEPRSWEFSGPLKLYPRPVNRILKVYRFTQKLSFSLDVDSLFKIMKNLSVGSEKKSLKPLDDFQK